MEKLQNLKLQVQTRAANESDVPFIFNSWLKSFYAAPTAKTILPAIYYDGQHKLIESLLKRSITLVACSTTDSTQLLGYIVAEIVEDLPIVHYAYVKHAFRNLGIYSLLASELKIENKGFYTHRTATAAKMFDNKLIYNPFLLNRANT